MDNELLLPQRTNQGPTTFDGLGCRVEVESVSSRPSPALSNIGLISYGLGRRRTSFALEFNEIGVGLILHEEDECDDGELAI